MIEYLPWDSEFFGHRIARLRELSPQLEAECRKQAIACLYLCLPPQDAGAAERFGATLVDVRVTSTRAARRAIVPLRHAVPDDVETLRHIARTAHRHSRFYVDSHFERDRCDDFYALWIEKSCRGWADAVLVAAPADKPVGYVTCHLKEARIGLVGVAEEARGRGIGKSLLRGALDWFAHQNCRTVEVVTQGANVPAQRLYQSCGFRTSRLELFYHKWFD